MLDSVLSSALRSFRRPMYAIMCVAVLSVGVTGMIVALAVHRSVIASPLPFAQPGELVRIRESKLPQFPNFAVAPAKFAAWSREARSFRSLAAFRFERHASTLSDDAVRMSGARVTAGFFDTLRVPLYAGSGFDARNPADQVILSTGIWQTRFGGRPDTIGKSLDLDGRPFEIVGIASPVLPYPNESTDVYTLWRWTAREETEVAQHSVQVIGRLLDGGAREVAVDELQRISDRVARDHGTNADWQVQGTPVVEDFLGDATARVGLFAAVALVLCATAFSSLIILGALRAAARAREQAVRSALGADRWRLLSEPFAEALSFGLVGAIASVVLAHASIFGIRHLAVPGLPRIDAIGLDAVAVSAGFALAFTLAMAALLLPALVRPAMSMVDQLRAGTRSSASKRIKRTRVLLVTFKVALAGVLGTSGLVLEDRFARISEVDPGFAPDGVHFVQLTPPAATFAEPGRIAAFYRNLLLDVAALPGVERASVTQALPMVRNWSLTFDLEGMPPSARGNSPSGTYYAASPGHLRALGVRLVSGRDFNEGDRADGVSVALVSESFAQRHFNGDRVIGRRIRAVNESVWREIVGVVGDVRQRGLASDVGPQVYAPFEQMPFREAYLVLRTMNEATTLRESLRDVVRRHEPMAVTSDATTLRSVIERSLVTDEFLRTLVASLAIVSFVLAGAGVYGTLATAIDDARPEIAVRLALGSSPRSEFLRVLRHGSLIGTSGAMLGLAGIALMWPWLRHAVSGPMPDLVLVFAGTSIAAVLAVVAAFVPGIRAMRMDPALSLRGGG